jgi:hypothetical protein
MDKQLFNDIINDVHLLGQVDMHAIKQLEERYPWFPLPHIMLAKQLHARQSPEYAAALAKAAAYSPDRSVLFQLLERTPLQEPITEMAMTIDSQSTWMEDIVEDILDEEVAMEQETNPNHDEPVFEYIPYEIEMQKAILELEKSGKGTTLPNFPVLGEEDKELGELPLDTTGTHTFMDWISLVAGTESVVLVHSSAAHKPIRVALRPGFVGAASAEEEDDFDEWKARELARRSTQLNEDAISETLAEILVIQGKKDRAVEIYQKLGLKYPEKMPYFAGLIEDLKNS